MSPPWKRVVAYEFVKATKMVVGLDAERKMVGGILTDMDAVCAQLLAGAQALAKVEELKAELAGLREDRAMMDFLEHYGADVEIDEKKPMSRDLTETPACLDARRHRTQVLGCPATYAVSLIEARVRELDSMIADEIKHRYSGAEVLAGWQHERRKATKHAESLGQLRKGVRL